MNENKDNQLSNKLSIWNKILNMFTLFLKNLPWKVIKGLGIILAVVLLLSFYTTLFNPSFWIYQSLSARDSIELFKHSLPQNDTCFIDYNHFKKLQTNNHLMINYKKDIHVIILDGLVLGKNVLLEKNLKKGHVFSSYHTIGNNKIKRINNFLNGKLNNGCIEESDEFLLTKIFEKKGYQVKTFIDNIFNNDILCSNSNNYINKIVNKSNKKSEYTSNHKPSFSLTILSESYNGLRLDELNEKIENIIMYQNSSFNNSYVILIESNKLMFYNSYLMVSLPLNEETKEHNKILLYNHDKPFTSNDLYKTLTTSNDNSSFVNVLTTFLPKRSCQEMNVPIENCQCQSHFFKVPKEMIKVIKVLKKRFVEDLENYFSNHKHSTNCLKKLREKNEFIETYYAFITFKKGIHFKMVLQLNDKRKIMALYNDNFFMISQSIVNIGENKAC